MSKDRDKELPPDLKEFKAGVMERRRQKQIVDKEKQAAACWVGNASEAMQPCDNALASIDHALYDFEYALKGSPYHLRGSRMRTLYRLYHRMGRLLQAYRTSL